MQHPELSIQLVLGRQRASRCPCGRSRTRTPGRVQGTTRRAGTTNLNSRGRLDKVSSAGGEQEQLRPGRPGRPGASGTAGSPAGMDTFHTKTRLWGVSCASVSFHFSLRTVRESFFPVARREAAFWSVCVCLPTTLPKCLPRWHQIGVSVYQPPYSLEGKKTLMKLLF